MKTSKDKLVILPGFSSKNKDWALECTEKLNNFEVKVVEWQHWTIGKADHNWIETELEKINSEIGNGKVCVVAKSIGTLVAAMVLKEKLALVDRLVLCGIPINDFNPGDETFYSILRDVDSSKLLVIQNENDSHGSFMQVKDFLYSISPSIQVHSKPFDNHEYPYWDDLKAFLE